MLQPQLLCKIIEIYRALSSFCHLAFFHTHPDANPHLEPIPPNGIEHFCARKLDRHQLYKLRKSHTAIYNPDAHKKRNNLSHFKNNKHTAADDAILCDYDFLPNCIWLFCEKSFVYGNNRCGGYSFFV